MRKLRACYAVGQGLHSPKPSGIFGPNLPNPSGKTRIKAKARRGEEKISINRSNEAPEPPGASLIFSR